MKVQITFEKDLPTSKMWEFATTIADKLELPYPEQEFSSVGKFISDNIQPYYREIDCDVNITTDGVWTQAFWMPTPQDEAFQISFSPDESPND